jgi:hypothetical protein
MGGSSDKGTKPTRHVTISEVNEGSISTSRSSSSSKGNNNNTDHRSCHKETKNTDHRENNETHPNHNNDLQNTATQASTTTGAQTTSFRSTINNFTTPSQYPRPGTQIYNVHLPGVGIVYPGNIPVQGTFSLSRFGIGCNPVCDTSNMQPLIPNPPPPTNNPPDQLGLPPPCQPLHPVEYAPVDPRGVHFQPPVPGTENGPMVHHYKPRHDPVVSGVPVVMAPGQPMPGTYMVRLQSSDRNGHTRCCYMGFSYPTGEELVSTLLILFLV